MHFLLTCACRSRARALDLVKKHVPEHLVSAVAARVLCPVRLLTRYSIYVCLSQIPAGHSQEDEVGGGATSRHPS